MFKKCSHQPPEVPKSSDTISKGTREYTRLSRHLALIAITRNARTTKSSSTKSTSMALTHMAPMFDIQEDCEEESIGILAQITLGIVTGMTSSNLLASRFMVALTVTVARFYGFM